MFVSPGEIAFSVGPLTIYYYGIIMALSICLGIFTAHFVCKKYYPGINAEVIYDISPHIIIGAIIGARLYYCALSSDYYLLHPLEIFQIWQGGISIHGAVLGGLVTGVLYSKKHKLPVLKICDIFSYGLVLGQALGRWGNFFNSEAFGLPYEGFLKLYIPIYKRPLEYMQFNYFHPTFLYESICDIIIFLILYFIIRKRTQGKDGMVFFAYLILYSNVRIVLEHLRVDSVLNVYGVPVAQLVSIIFILLSVVAILKIEHNVEKYY